MKCEICDKDAPYFTEVYNPDTKECIPIYLCLEHHCNLCTLIDRGIRTMKYLETYNRAIGCVNNCFENKDDAEE
jgi:hypothetical protein